MTGITRTIAQIVVALATVFVILGLSVVLFVNPLWVGFEQARTGAAALTGLQPSQVAAVTDGVLGDLVLGPPAFDQEVDGSPVFNERERSHLVDVRSVFSVFAVMAIASAVIVVAGYVATRGAPWFRHAMGTGAAVLGVGVVAAAIAVAIAFDTVFELFHELLFAGGTYSFDPTTDRLVQLFPEAFWQETAVAVGVVILVLSTLVSLWARRPWRAT